MNQHKNIGLIKCGGSEEMFDLGHYTDLKKSIKKIYFSTPGKGPSAETRFPHAEIVPDKQFILDDHHIDHLIIHEPGADDLQLIAEAIKTGKQVQIIDK